MGTVTLLIVAASALGACIALIRLLRIYNERPIWHREAGKRSPGQAQLSRREVDFRAAEVETAPSPSLSQSHRL